MLKFSNCASWSNSVVVCSRGCKGHGKGMLTMTKALAGDCNKKVRRVRVYNIRTICLSDDLLESTNLEVLPESELVVEDPTRKPRLASSLFV